MRSKTNLNPYPYTLHPAPYTLHPTPYTLHPTPYTLHPQAYGGFTFAFKDYQDGLNLTTHVDDPIMGTLLDTVDPVNYLKRLSRIPVCACVCVHVCVCM